ncbi:hypothetical protein [Psychrobacillus sp. L3]|uniref:hypothetical protein n=1 Tax=Psychrobacillus sp. L3 TaxID=3236891 RepID=UPI0036F3A3C7
MRQNRIVVLSEDELEQLVFNAARRACSNLYDGLAQRFFYSHDDYLKSIVTELEYLNRK